MLFRALAYIALGWLLMKQREFVEAEARFHEAIRLNPQRRESFHGLGRALVEQGKYREAEEPLLEVLRLDPDHQYAPSLLKRARNGLRRVADEGAPLPATEN